ncbi:MAG: glycogen/starch/alpha-glucan phosphorylase [Acidobacteriota bacterium]
MSDDDVTPGTRTIPRPHPGGLDPRSITDSFAFRMMYSVARDQYNATDLDAFHALAYAVRDRLMERWFATQDAYYQLDVKRVYYLSLEFLLGRLLISSMINLGAEGAYAEAMKRLGFQLEDLAERESDAGLGNGGLGRLAACFLESAATLGLPFYGYGIRYEYGIFRQKIVDGQQVEAPDPWLRYGTPWEIPRPDALFAVKFYGRTEYYVDPQGRGRIRWVDTDDLYAMAYDSAMPGYRNDTVNSLRLWAAKSSREFDLARFNAGEYVQAVQDKTSSENISKVLYPSDERYEGRELRLKQQYFFVSATIQDVMRRFIKRAREGWSELPDKVAIQLNDTHPAIAIPEMMRVLVDEEAVDWDAAWSICQRVFAYTNHTVLPEALEAWPVELLGHVLPRHLEIVREIDRRLRALVVELLPGEVTAIPRVAIEDKVARTIRMANLAIAGSHSVNGVARLHTDILQQRTFPELDRLFPGRFNNKTNGVTPRRWLLQSNRELSNLISSAIGDDWPRDLTRLAKLVPLAEDGAFRSRWAAVKRRRKVELANWMRRSHRLELDPDSLFDVQVKRFHEYKRQLLNVMHVLALVDRIADGDDDVVPRTVIFGGKAAPGYRIAKLLIRLVHQVAASIESNRRVSRLLKVVFVPNYDVSSAEMLFPATELSEQISTAGTEASGTGCMKAILNGGVVMGTLDGANIEIRDAVGEQNIFTFGHTAGEIVALRAQGYDPRQVIAGNPELSRVLTTIASWDTYSEIIESIAGKDHFFNCADFEPYVTAQKKAARTWQDRETWTRLSILNTAHSASFSSDRTVAQYAKEIWGAEPVPIKFDKG